MKIMGPVFLGLFLLSAPAMAAGDGALSADKLKTYCAGQFDVDAGFCAGYITAVADFMKQKALPGYSVCNLSPVGSQQLMELVQSQMQEQAFDPAMPATSLTADTLARYYPCR